jgi:hypothetical protein
VELSPDREDELLVQFLRDRVGVDPRSLRPILRLAALGLVRSAWRDTCVEDWHAAGRLLDGEMLRISSQMCWRMDQLLGRWRAKRGIAAGAPAVALDEVGFGDLRRLGGRVYEWIVNPYRELPTGATVGEVARGSLPQLERDADGAVTAFVCQAEDRGAGFAFRWAAAHGGLACRHWWGHPAWPGLVDRFISALDDPEDPHWGDSGEFRVGLRAEPAAVQDRPGLRRTLLRQPWSLDFGSAEWIVSAGIGVVRGRG